MGPALRRRLLLENPADDLKQPQQPRGEMQVLKLEQTRVFLEAVLATLHDGVLAIVSSRFLTRGDTHRKQTGFVSDIEQRPAPGFLHASCGRAEKQRCEFSPLVCARLSARDRTQGHEPSRPNGSPVNNDRYEQQADECFLLAGR